MKQAEWEQLILCYLQEKGCVCVCLRQCFISKESMQMNTKQPWNASALLLDTARFPPSTIQVQRRGAGFSALLQP